MGPSPRGGAYTYDWIENLLGLNMHSADTLLPEFQNPRVGDTIGYGSSRMRLERVEAERVLAFRSENGNWVWTFVLSSGDDRTTLISRNRFRLPTLAARIGMVPMEPASLVMERKMLVGIKQRAEKLAASGPALQPSWERSSSSGGRCEPLRGPLVADQHAVVFRQRRASGPQRLDRWFISCTASKIVTKSQQRTMLGSLASWMSAWSARVAL